MLLFSFSRWLAGESISFYKYSCYYRPMSRYICELVEIFFRGLARTFLGVDPLLYPDTAKWAMPREVLESYIRQYIEAHDEPVVHFAWQGGEPTLLRVEYFRQIVARQDCMLRVPGFYVTFARVPRDTVLHRA
jgi:hypothetical protein